MRCRRTQRGRRRVTWLTASHWKSPLCGLSRLKHGARRHRFTIRLCVRASIAPYGVTVIVPTMFGWMAQWKWYVPAVLNVMLYVSPGRMRPEVGKAPLSDII